MRYDYNELAISLAVLCMGFASVVNAGYHQIPAATALSICQRAKREGLKQFTLAPVDAELFVLNALSRVFNICTICDGCIDSILIDPILCLRQTDDRA